MEEGLCMCVWVCACVCVFVSGWVGGGKYYSNNTAGGKV